MTVTFEHTRTPTDESPPTEAVEGHTDYDPEFPGSTPDAPYGFKPNGEPYKRRPNNTAGSKTGGGKRGVASDSQARAAARMLAQLNSLVGMSLNAAGLPQTAESINDANQQFEAMALEALRTDPALCKKILAGGAMSGRTALVMAYGYLGMAALPAAKSEIMERRRLAQEGNEDEQV